MKTLTDELADALRHLHRNAKHSGAEMGLALIVAEDVLAKYEAHKAQIHTQAAADVDLSVVKAHQFVDTAQMQTTAPIGGEHGD